jgi:hypothetical protein
MPARKHSASPAVAPHLDEGFDPDAAATGDGLFGLATTPADASVVVIPVPFDATTSYRPGTARGPEAVLEASKQVDLEDLQYGAIWKAGIAMLPISRKITALSKSARKAAEPVIAAGGAEPGNRAHAKALAAVNAASASVNEPRYVPSPRSSMRTSRGGPSVGYGPCNVACHVSPPKSW